MAKKMRRWIAFLLALVLCVGQLAVPSMAAEEESNLMTPSSVEVDPETGVTTVTFKTETTDPETGVTTTKTETEITDPSTGAVTKGTSTETEKTDVTNDGAHVETKGTQEGVKNTTYPEENSTEGKSDVKVEKETTENSEGSSSQVIDTQPSGPNEQTTTVTENGEQKSETKTTTTTTTTTDDVKKDDPIYEHVGSTVPGDVETKSDNTEQDGQWQEGDLSNQTQWVDGKPVEGTDVTDPEKGETVTGENVVLNDTLKNEEDVKVELKPDGKWYQGTVDVTTEKLLSGEYGIFNPDDHEGSEITTVTDNSGRIVKVTVVDTDGTVTTIEASNNEEGVTGWMVTTVTEQHGERQQQGEIKENATEVQNGTTTEFIRDASSEAEVAKGTQETKDENGNTVKTTVERIEENGEIKYRTTEDTITVTEVVTTAPVDSQTHEDHYQEVTDKEEKGFRPVAAEEIPQEVVGEVREEEGVQFQVNVTVEPIVADANSQWVKEGYVQEGAIIGYRSLTTKTSPENNYSRTETREIYGTAYSVNVTTTTDPHTLETHVITTTTDRKIQDQYFSQKTRKMDVDLEKTDNYETTIFTEEDIYTILDAEDGSYFEINGMMGVVVGTVQLENNYSIASGTIAKDKNGNWYLKSTTVPMTGEDLRPSSQFSNNYNGQFKVGSGSNQWNGTYTGKNGEWVQIGRGLYGGFTTWDESASNSNLSGRHTPQQYMIYNGKEVRFVYCVELNTSAPSGSYYGTDKKSDEENGEAVWFKPDGTPSEGTVEKIRIIATNGFWGTQSGVGSLQAVKDLLIKYNYADVAERLTEGMAMAGTQLGLWEYGNTSNGKEFKDTYKKDKNGNLLTDVNGLYIGNGDYVTWDDSTNAAPTAQVKEDIAVVRNLLIALAEGTLEGGKTEQITADSITGGAIIVKEQVINESTGELVKDDEGNIKYSADVQMKMDITTSSINGDLVLKVYNYKDEMIGSYRLAGDDDFSMFDLVTTRIYPDENGVYTLENLELFENRPITLNLDGIQQMDDGVYIYTNKNMQDFVGLATQENRVDLEVTMQFEVVDPEVSHVSTTSTQKRTDSITSTATADRTDKAVFVRTVVTEQQLTQTTTRKYIRSKITTKEIQKEMTMELFQWDSRYENTLTTVNDEDGNGWGDFFAAFMIPVNEIFNNDLTIPEEPVPLAAAPKTGDLSLMWAMFSLLSLAGAAALFVDKKKSVK